MKLLENFYNEKIFIPNTEMKQFNELEQWQKDTMENSFSFEMYRFKDQWKNLKKDFNHVAFWTYLFIALMTTAFFIVVYTGFKIIFNL